MADPVVQVPVELRETEWLLLAPPTAKFVFRGDAQAREAAGAVFGAPLATEPGRAVTRDDRAALSLGPDEHLLVIADGDATAFEAALGSALASRPFSLVDVSHRQVTLELRGPHAGRLLAAACPLPLDVEDFPVGACTRTVFAKAEIVLWRNGPEAMRIEVARSFCPYVVGLLHEVAREV